MEAIRTFLNSYIEGKGIKQKYISEKTGLECDVISRILRGKRKILASEFLQICRAIEVPQEEIDKLSATILEN